MRYLAIGLLGSLSACASHPAPPAASAASVEAATNTPSNGPSFAPVGVDGQAAAPADQKTMRTPATASTSEGSSSAPVQTWGGSTDQAPSNAAAMPAPSRSPYEADNSRVNARDRNGTTLTPMDQGKSEADRKLTQQIRRAVVDDTSLSFRAKNIKIITLNGKVTLRGAVKSDAERISVAALARKIAGESPVENYLEVSE